MDKNGEWKTILFTFIFGASIARFITFMTTEFGSTGNKPGDIIVIALSRDRHWKSIHGGYTWVNPISNIIIYISALVAVIIPIIIWRKLNLKISNGPWGYITTVVIALFPFAIMYLGGFFLLFGYNNKWLNDGGISSLFNFVIYVVVFFCLFLCTCRKKRKELDAD